MRHLTVLSAEGVECVSVTPQKEQLGWRGGSGPLEMESGVCQIGLRGYTLDPIFKEEQQKHQPEHCLNTLEVG